VFVFGTSGVRRLKPVTTVPVVCLINLYQTRFNAHPFTESSELEVVRLRRRVKELELAFKSISTLGGAAGGVRSAGTGAWYFLFMFVL